MSTWNNMNYFKRQSAIKRVQFEMIKENKKTFMNKKFNEIIELKLKWELGEISKDTFMKSTKDHIMDCWAFKHMNKKHLSAIKIQKIWREYKNKKNIINDIIIDCDNSLDWRSYENDILEQTIYVWDDSWQI